MAGNTADHTLIVTEGPFSVSFPKLIFGAVARGFFTALGQCLDRESSVNQMAAILNANCLFEFRFVCRRGQRKWMLQMKY